MILNIPNDKKELFLKTLYAGIWVVGSFEEKEENMPVMEMEQELLKQFAGDSECVEKDVVDGKEFFTYNEELEDDASDMMEEYEEKTYFETLIEGLVQRDLLEKYSPDELENTENTNVQNDYVALYNKYGEEFKNNGVENLYVVDEE